MWCIQKWFSRYHVTAINLISYFTTKWVMFGIRKKCTSIFVQNIVLNPSFARFSWWVKPRITAIFLHKIMVNIYDFLRNLAPLKNVLHISLYFLIMYQLHRLFKNHLESSLVYKRDLRSTLIIIRPCVNCCYHVTLFYIVRFSQVHLLIDIWLHISWRFWSQDVLFHKW